ncbi:hypothetical protein V501_01699 [Pseudogymnoascus sp. VKM F-4519 (FW-2642)]|nr:hypothetical protein V501_01699 [Pseudogymnoascus sp. VKM F-4519 (FW-2642)]
MRPIQWPVNDRLKPQIYEKRTNRGYYAVATKEDGTLAAYTIAKIPKTSYDIWVIAVNSQYGKNKGLIIAQNIWTATGAAVQMMTS